MPRSVSSTHIALLRAINVGGHNKVSMKPLAALFEQLGCTRVRTYIQSGNVVFDASPKVMLALAAQVEARIAAEFGCRVPVVLRSAAELQQVAQTNPYLARGDSDEHLHVGFLQTAPRAACVARLDPARSAPDSFTIQGSDIYLQFISGTGKTKLTTTYFDSTLKNVMTTRNWRTVLKLAEMSAT